MKIRTTSTLTGLFLLLSIPFVIVVGMVWMNYATGDGIARDTANNLVERTRHETINSTEELIEPISSLVRVAASLGAAEPGYFRRDQSFRYLDAMLAHSLSLDNVYVAFADGSFRASARVHRHTRINDQIPPDKATTYTRWIDRSKDKRPVNHINFYGEKSQAIIPWTLPTDYDPRLRPWFMQAKAAGKLILSGPYIYATAQVAGITLAMPFYLDGQLAGIVGADITLDFLANFLATRPVSKNSISLILDRDNRVVAHPDPQQAFKQENGQLVRNTLDKLSNDLPAMAIASVADATTERFNFVDTRSGQQYLALRSKLPAAIDQSWSLLIVAPLSDFSGPLTERNHLLLQIGLVFIAIEMLLIVPLSRRINRNNQEKDSALQETIKAQQTMVDNLRQHERELEERVAQRTEELMVSNRKLEALSTTDSLTGIANRRRFDESLCVEWSRASRAQQSVALAMIDVDRFKKYNDHYGHPAGDECLRRVTQVLSEVVCRQTDMVARYGGEEFAFIAPAISPDDALTLAQSICNALQALALPHEASEFGCVTVSIGVAVMVPAAGQDAQALVNAADDALYKAKSQGRNQTAVADSHTPSPSPDLQG